MTSHNDVGDNTRCVFWARTWRVVTFQYPHHLSACSKDKAIQLQAWSGPEGSKSLGLPDFKIIGT